MYESLACIWSILGLFNQSHFCVWFSTVAKSHPAFFSQLSIPSCSSLYSSSLSNSCHRNTPEIPCCMLGCSLVVYTVTPFHQGTSFICVSLTQQKQRICCLWLTKLNVSSYFIFVLSRTCPDMFHMGTNKHIQPPLCLFPPCLTYYWDSLWRVMRLTSSHNRRKNTPCCF